MIVGLIVIVASRGWPKFPKDHFQGPFNAITSHPLLLIGNTAGKFFIIFLTTLLIYAVPS